MAHYAVLDADNTVTQVFVGRDEDDLAPGVDNWETYYAPEGMTVKRTSYNTRGGIYYDSQTGKPSSEQSKAFRKNYAGKNFTYDETRDAFIPPKKFDSWVLDEETCLWNPPIEMPDDGEVYIWDEGTLNWVLIDAD